MKKASLIIFLTFCFLNLFSKSNLDSIYAKDVYFQKIIKTNSKVPVFYNDEVKINITHLLKNTSNETSVILGKLVYYQKTLGGYFDKVQIPQQLFLTAYASSHVNVNYVSPDGVSGLWGLQHAIAQKYDLVTNSYVDERRDPEKSTIAVAKCFVDVNKIYNDWLKTIVACRIGPINLNLAIRRSGNSMDYEVIHKKLSAVDRQYVEKYMAIWYVWNFYTEYKIKPFKKEFIDYDTVHVQKEVSFAVLSDFLEMPIVDLQTLNPELRLNIVPVFYNKIGLKLPAEKIDVYRNKYLEIFPPEFILVVDTLVIDSLGNDSFVVIKKPIEFNKHLDQKNKNTSKATVIYTVKKGDVLNLIADIFDVSINDIKNKNTIKRNTVLVGQKLKIEVPLEKKEYYNKINKMTMAQKKKMAKKS